MEPPDETDPLAPPPREPEVLVLGMIHGGHRTSEAYGLPVIQEIVRRVDPDYVLCEIPPDRIEAATYMIAAAATGGGAKPPAPTDRIVFEDSWTDGRSSTAETAPPISDARW